MVVSYGGHGGEQAAAQIKTVIGPIGMRVVEHQVNMSFPSFEYLDKAFKGDDLGLDASSDTGPWAEHRSKIAAVFWDEMIDKDACSGMNNTCARDKMDVPTSLGLIRS